MWKSVEETLLTWIGEVNGYVWGWPTLILLVGTGIFLTLRLGFLQVRTLPYALKLVFSRNKKDETAKGDISHFQSLMTALAATIGTGNIAGVATAVATGGPGAIFWMWITALFGMATKYAEAILAVKYRTTNEKGQISGGPMYYIERGLGMKWLAILFALFGSIAAFGIGNMVQSHSVASALTEVSGNAISPGVTGLVLAILTGLVLLGGIRSIGRITSFVVPFMAVFYILGGITIILLNIDAVPKAFALIFEDAFTGQAMAGGVLGQVIKMGVARGLFSNEAGLGSAPIAAAAAKTDHPGRQALVSMTGTFLDTIVVCTITGLAIVMTGAYDNKGLEGPQITVAAFDTVLPTIGGLIVSIGLILFAYSTILGWSYYGEKCFTYLFSDKTAIFYRTVFVLAVFIGSMQQIDLVWTLSDTMNGLMALPNLVGLLFLSSVVVSETKDFQKIVMQEKLKEKQTS
ncbi:alanine/glycine:cation symporter family protein [Melghirimyces algeriensis]|uniref:Alanine or glycine:cation symporter, AGCS family n=1 Tax=Melghirimyces algeriensis TaxID=910412 RepID=A0A521CP71_9BACL|nr:sodium:alanine symporter family protein [Melghirimyces algeriensis]SMO61226.1 alanine or glycine:cation symporter, AGCS family [Melghirimyces algeriensis]